MAAGSVVMIFVKAPSLGAVKTRLLPILSPTQAAQLYRCLVADTLQIVSRVDGAQALVAYAPNDEFPDLSWLSSELEGSVSIPEAIRQEGSTLGDRLIHACERAFARGARRVVVLGSDAPELPEDWVANALASLDSCDVVLGPATDGGYHLIGLSQPRPALFTQMPWSSPELLDRTLERIQRLKLRVRCLQPVADLDTPDDLKRYVATRLIGRVPERVSMAPRNDTAQYLRSLLDAGAPLLSGISMPGRA